MSRRIMTRQEVEAHSGQHSAYVIIDNVVYDVTPFLEEHPGGEQVLLENAGRDATKCFRDVGHSELARDLRGTLAVAEVPEEERRPVEPWPIYVHPEDEPLSLHTVLNIWAMPMLLMGLAVSLYLYLFE